jgi:hypothetical protein
MPDREEVRLLSALQGGISTPKTEIKKFFLKISGLYQSWLRPLPGAIRIPPAGGR